MIDEVGGEKGRDDRIVTGSPTEWSVTWTVNRKDEESRFKVEDIGNVYSQRQKQPVPCLLLQPRYSTRTHNKQRLPGRVSTSVSESPLSGSYKFVLRFIFFIFQT